MHPTRKRRLFLLSWLLIGTAVVVGLVLYALRQNINVFYTPTQLSQGVVHPKQRFYAGGTVVKGSIQRGKDLHIQFVLSDSTHQVTVLYQGVLPDLFREGDMAVVAGTLDKDIVYADQILAKHDENYKPR